MNQIKQALMLLLDDLERLEYNNTYARFKSPLNYYFFSSIARMCIFPLIESRKLQVGSTQTRAQIGVVESAIEQKEERGCSALRNN